MKTIKQCKWKKCRKAFRGDTNKTEHFCSRKCAAAFDRWKNGARQEDEDSKCGYCGTPMTNKKKGRMKKWCSARCAMAVSRAKKKGAETLIDNAVKCPACGKKNPTDIITDGKFCGWECRERFKKRRQRQWERDFKLKAKEPQKTERAAQTAAPRQAG